MRGAQRAKPMKLGKDGACKEIGLEPMPKAPGGMEKYHLGPKKKKKHIKASWLPAYGQTKKKDLGNKGS